MRAVNVREIIDKAKVNNFFKLVTFVCLFTIIGDGFDINAFGMIIPTLMKDWHLGPAQVGLLGSYGMFGMIFGSFAFGPLADNIGKKRAMIIGTIVYIAFTISCGFSHSFQVFAIFRFIAGFALAGVFPLAVAFVSEYSPKATRSRLTSLITGGVPMGTMIAGLSGILLISTYGWRSMFYISGVLVIMIVLQCFLPESIGFLKLKGDNRKIGQILQRIDPSFKATPEDDYQLPAKDTGKGSPLDLFRNGYARNTFLFWGMMVFNFLAIYGVFMWLPKLMTLKGYSLKASLFLTMCWHAGCFGGLPTFGKMADAIGGKRTLQIGWVILAVLTVIVAFMNGLVPLIIMLFITGGVQAGVSGVAGSYMAQSYPTSFRATGTAWGYGLGRLGATVGPLLGGILMAHKIPVSWNLAVFGLFPLIALGFASFTHDFFTHEAHQATTIPAKVSE